MGNKIGTSIKNGYNKAKNFAGNTINSIGSSLKPVVSNIGNGMNSIGSSIKSGRDWIKNIPVIGGLANTAMDSLGINKAIDTGTNILSGGGNMLGQLSNGDFSGAFNTGLNTVGNLSGGAGSYMQRGKNLINTAGSIGRNIDRGINNGSFDFGSARRQTDNLLNQLGAPSDLRFGGSKPAVVKPRLR
jgi:hypothetical protein